MANAGDAEPSIASNPLLGKVKKVIDTHIENDENLLEGLKSLSDFFPDNTIHSRRNLRSQIEKRNVDIHKNFLDEFSKVKKELDNIDTMVADMNQSCMLMKERLNVVKSHTQDLITQTTQLRSDSQKLEMKARIADAMLAAFQLSQQEMQFLLPDTQQQQPLTEEFFHVIQKVKEINERSHLILRTQNQTLGLEIMDSMSYHIEAAYERLYRWTYNECRMLTHELPEISSLLCQALQCLQERPVLFKYVLDEYATARRNALVRCFIDALTKGGSSGWDSLSHSTTMEQKPIDLLSHDCLRYVGDMSAWLHQGVASERELLRTLLKKCDSSNLCTTPVEILNHITEGLCRMFKNRLEQVLLSEKQTIDIYRLNNLLQFYKNTLGQLLSEETTLYLTLDETQKLAWRLFLTSLKNSMLTAISRPEPPSVSLAASPVIKDTLNLLETILTSQDVSMVTLTVRKAEFLEVLNALVDSLIQYCNLSATSLNAVDAAAYLINSLHLLQTGLARLEYTDDKIQQIQSHLDAYTDTLVSEQAGHILQSVHLVELYQCLQAGHDAARDGPLARMTRVGVSASSIKEASSALDQFLCAPDNVQLPQMNKVVSGNLREVIRQRAAALVHTAYTSIHAAVSSPANGYPDTLAQELRSPDEVAKLLLN